MSTKRDRKRSFQQADLNPLDNNQSKKRKITDNTNQTNQTNPDNNPFAAFASNSNAFSSFLNNNITNNKSPSLSTKATDLKISTSQSSNDSLNETKSDLNKKLKELNEIDQIFATKSDENQNEIVNNNSFDAFINKGFNDDNNGFDNNIDNGFGNKQQTEFKFDESASNFDISTIITNDNDNDNRNDKAASNPDRIDPIAHLSGKISNFGDDNDDILYSLKCKIYELNNDKYNEKGIGFVKFNKYFVNNDDMFKLRLLCRREVVLNTILNVNINKNTKFEKVNQKQIRFTVFQQIENNDDDDNDNDVVIKPKIYLLSLFDKKKMGSFLATIKEYQDKLL